MLELTPPKTSIYSVINLKGTLLSNSRPFPGAIEKKKPKSI